MTWNPGITYLPNTRGGVAPAQESWNTYGFPVGSSEAGVADTSYPVGHAFRYGAIGDGVSDDTTALRAALVAATGTTAYLPAGTYKVTGTLTVPTGTRLCGEGRAVTVLVFSGMSSTNAITLSSATESVVEHLSVTGTFQFGVYVTGGARNVVQDCVVTGGTVIGAQNYGGGILGSACTDLVIQRNRLYGNGNTDSNAYADILVNALGAPSTGLTIRDNTCASTAAHFGILVFDVVRAQCIGNRCTGATTYIPGHSSGYGIDFYKSAGPLEDIETSNNLVYDVEGIGIYYQGVTRGAITGNIVNNAASVQVNPSLDVASITLNTCSAVTVTGNVLVESGHDGIGFNAPSEYCTIVGNTIRDATRYGVYADGVSDTMAVGLNSVSGSGTADYLLLDGLARTVLGGDLTLEQITVGTTVGAAGGASALPATPTGYVTATINGTARKIPYYAT
jgi:nitrous oxidase accessory protein NosD